MNVVMEMPLLNPARMELQEPDSIIIELNLLQQHSTRQELLSRLHDRMANTLNLASIIEAYSIWLMPSVTHELIGYSNTSRNTKFLFCSGHGPDRRKAIAFAERLIDGEGSYEDTCGLFGRRWVLETAQNSGILLILKAGQDLENEEIALVNDSLEILSNSLQRGLAFEDLLERANRDQLTGLANHRVFNDRIEGMIKIAERHDRPLTMLSMDLDYGEGIDAAHGNPPGDETLKSVAKVLAEAVRSTDSAGAVGPEVNFCLFWKILTWKVPGSWQKGLIKPLQGWALMRVPGMMSCWASASAWPNCRNRKPCINGWTWGPMIPCIRSRREITSFMTAASLFGPRTEIFSFFWIR